MGYDSYLAHHGVKGMKWGVYTNKKAYKKGASTSIPNRKRSGYLAYTTVNRKGVEKQRHVRLGRRDFARLQTYGGLNSDGSISTEQQKKVVREYINALREQSMIAAYAWNM